MTIKELLKDYNPGTQLLINWGDSFRRCTINDAPITLLNSRVIKSKTINNELVIDIILK